MTENHRKVERLDRILAVRQIAVDAAEVRVRACEGEIRRLEIRLASEEGKIRQFMEEFAHMNGMTGMGLQRSEKSIAAAQIRAGNVRQSIETVGTKLDENRELWREAQREKKTVEKLRERQLQKVSREEAVLMQKVIDEVSVTRHLRKTRA